MPSSVPHPLRPVRSFVRREGRLTDAQRDALNRLWPRFGLEATDLVAPHTPFGRRAALVLEIGFGNGETLAEMARTHPETDFIGIEVHRPGVGQLLRRIEQWQLHNLRLLCADANEVLPHLPPHCLQRIQIYFPDPWPKKRHHKRRLIQPALCQRLRDVLVVGGLLHLATDWPPYAEHMFAVLDATPGLLNCAATGVYVPRPDWRPISRFERRGQRLGHPIHDLVFRHCVAESDPQGMSFMPQPPIRRALLSVSDKRHLLDLAGGLHARGIELLSTGGTARLLLEAGLPVTEVAEHTGQAEIMDGRVKTLHPKIHGGLLGRRGIDDALMQAEGIAPIDLLVVNLYPFEATIAAADCTFEHAIENIDIGGPAMLRAAAKNHAAVTVLVDSDDYARVLAELEANQGTTTASTRRALALKAFEHTARYDGAIANYLASLDENGERAIFPSSLSWQYQRRQVLRYGENPHQLAAFYRERDNAEVNITNARQLQGKELSYNNIADSDAALECVRQFSAPACVIIKHANPCGVAVTTDQLAAYELAWRTDPESAFGGIIAFNQPLQAATATAILDRQFVEVILAPGCEDAAIEVLQRKRNVRMLVCDTWNDEPRPRLDLRQVNGGLLVQQTDVELWQSLSVVTQRQPEATELADLQFAWRVAKFVKSNAIVYASHQATIGVGAGQMSRVNSARIAQIKAEQAGLDVTGAVMASDAFFPFRDGIDQAAAAGIRAVIQPGGSVRDEEVIAAANEHGMTMLFTSMRHFRH